MTFVKWNKIFSATLLPELTNLAMECIRNPVIQEGDIACSVEIDGEEYDIDLQMTSKFNFWPDRLPFNSILDRLTVDNTVIMNVWRERQQMKIPMILKPNYNIFKEMFADTDHIPYAAIGGVIIMSLLYNHIPIFKRENLFSIMNRPQNSHESILIITHILPESPFNESESVGAGDIVVGINDITVRTLQDLKEQWSKMQDYPSITLRMRDGSLASASSDAINQANTSAEINLTPFGV